MWLARSPDDGPVGPRPHCSARCQQFCEITRSPLSHASAQHLVPAQIGPDWVLGIAGSGDLHFAVVRTADARVGLCGPAQEASGDCGACMRNARSDGSKASARWHLSVPGTTNLNRHQIAELPSVKKTASTQIGRFAWTYANCGFPPPAARPA